MKARKQKTAVIPFRMPEDMQKAVRKVATQARLSDADIMRMALDRGLPVLEKMFEHDKKAA
jgi:hypothetical protein